MATPVYTVIAGERDSRARSGWHFSTAAVFVNAADALAYCRARIGDGMDGPIIEKAAGVYEVDARGVHQSSWEIVVWDGATGERVKPLDAGDGWVSDYLPFRELGDGATARMLTLDRNNDETAD